ncbi:cysteine proteinase [Conidiobolus coronatus NRRL 28638]|uniref:Ubiquitin carboxyl-terminal hydrolase n=1 Tax=Conidiobolus coronatus (strain ATCC 28846 / CBS 209.66 / NRRL 28638) TaxID=796925 RepID=A0A137PHB8_CONC2|nr:cysteine proteinase [Conidiobolus coronatus NRRL 28638]|eukprot:KXN74397.1 cysteine proteinase [Conidiobolus coronatus NRRL 28638]
MLKIYLGFREDSYESKFRYTSLLITSLKKFFPISTKLETRLIDFINNKISKPSTAIKNLCFSLDIGRLWSSCITFNLIINYKLTKSSEYSPVIKLKYNEFNSNYGIIQTSNGCIIILLSYKNPKFINLKYSITPTKPEFEILLDIMSANFKDTNFEEVIFKDEIKYIDETQYINGLENLGNTCFMNSAIQCIMNNPHIKLFFQTFSRINNLKFDKNYYPLLYATHQMHLQLQFNKSEYNQIRTLIRAIREYVPMYKDNSPDDASEFLQSFLGILHKELLIYFNRCTRLYTTLFEEEFGSAYSYLKSNNSYFKNLFLGLASNTVTCDYCNYTESVNFPITELQLNIPEKKIVLINIKILPYDNNQSQSIYNLQVAINSQLSLRELKCDISELISIPIRRLAVAIEIYLDKFYKELRVIEYEGESIENLVNANSDLYFFELPEHYTKEGWIFIFINQGAEKSNKFIHFSYSLCLIPIVHILSFKYFCECLISNIERGSNTQLSSQAHKDIMKQGYGSGKFSKQNSVDPVHIDENLKILYLKQDEYVYCIKNIFEIFKSNWLNFNYQNDKITLKIQEEAEFNAALPLFNGDNIIIKWRRHYLTPMFYQFLSHEENPFSNTKELEYSKYSLKYLSNPLTSLTYTSLTYIDYIKDLFNGNEFKNQGLEHETSLEDCIRDYLKTTYLKPQENTLLNWECNYCHGNYGQIRETISKFPAYLIIKLNRFKLDYESSMNTDKNSKLVNYLLEVKFNELDKLLNYSLISVCEHFGDIKGGHYTATCKNSSNDKWYNYNDEFVNSVDEDDIVSSSSYILIYQSKDAFITKEPLNLEELPLKTKKLCTIKH